MSKMEEAITIDPLFAGKWSVWRHGGRRNDKWHAIRWDETEAPCQHAYEKARSDMRQGGVQLISPNGEIVDSGWAPRVRSRW
jgi:hypothetical protein